MSVLFERLLGMRAQMRAMLIDISQLIDEVREVEKEETTSKTQQPTERPRPTVFGSKREIEKHGNREAGADAATGGNNTADERGTVTDERSSDVKSGTEQQ